jgi:ABC-2 type transport system ATP-binding protein
MLPVSITALSKIYRGKKGRQVEALKALTLHIQPGEVFGFLGPNGAGKSTTIKSLIGQLRPSAGSATIFGLPVTDFRARCRVGYLPENPSFHDFLTAREYLAMTGRLFGLDRVTIATRTDEVLNCLGLTEAANRPIRSYSKGMVQRFGLARTMLHAPDLFILDEPMSGLDPLGRALVKTLIRDLKDQGKTVFFSSHITSDIELVCDRVGVIVAGRLQAVLPIEQVLEQGVEGYAVQVAGCPAERLAPFACREKTHGVLEVYVPRAEFSDFSRRLDAAGGEVRLIETRRKDLEAFFLEIVEKRKL